jgi:serine/threonine protein kinase
MGRRLRDFRVTGPLLDGTSVTPDMIDAPGRAVLLAATCLVTDLPVALKIFRLPPENSTTSAAPGSPDGGGPPLCAAGVLAEALAQQRCRSRHVLPIIDAFVDEVESTTAPPGGEPELDAPVRFAVIVTPQVPTTLVRLTAGGPVARVTSLYDVIRAASMAPPSSQLCLVAVAAWFRQLALALASTHAAGIVHGDVTPANIFLVPCVAKTETPYDEHCACTMCSYCFEVQLGDFGLATQVVDGAAAARRSSSPTFQGTPGLSLAPECVLDTAPGTPRDVWAAGVTLACMIMGSVQSPFAAAVGRDQESAKALFAATCSAGGQFPPQVARIIEARSPHAAKIIAICIDPRPEYRPDAKQLVQLAAGIPNF